MGASKHRNKENQQLQEMEKTRTVARYARDPGNRNNRTPAQTQRSRHKDAEDRRSRQMKMTERETAIDAQNQNNTYQKKPGGSWAHELSSSRPPSRSIITKTRCSIISEQRKKDRRRKGKHPYTRRRGLCRRRRAPH